VWSVFRRLRVWSRCSPSAADPGKNDGGDCANRNPAATIEPRTKTGTYSNKNRETMAEKRVITMRY
jgi:hypothetical protein